MWQAAWECYYRNTLLEHPQCTLQGNRRCWVCSRTRGWGWGPFTSEVKGLETKDSLSCTWRRVQSIYFVFCRNGELNYFPVTCLLCLALRTDPREVIFPAVLVGLNWSNFLPFSHCGVPARLYKSYSKADHGSSFILSHFFLWPSGALCGVKVFSSCELAIAQAHSEAWASWCASELVQVHTKTCHYPKPRGYQGWQTRFRGQQESEDAEDGEGTLAWPAKLS